MSKVKLAKKNPLPNIEAMAKAKLVAEGKRATPLQMRREIEAFTENYFREIIDFFWTPVQDWRSPDMTIDEYEKRSKFFLDEARRLNLNTVDKAWRYFWRAKEKIIGTLPDRYAKTKEEKEFEELRKKYKRHNASGKE